MSDSVPGERQARMVLNALPGMGPAMLRKLLPVFDDDPCAVLCATREQLAEVPGLTAKAAESVLRWKSLFDPAREEARLRVLGGDLLTEPDPAYPALLREIHDPPIALYRLGHYDMDAPCVAIVGTRRATPYGIAQARALATGLARAGFCVVSGMARGIDTVAHEAALDAGGPTVAVMGTGIDDIYPTSNRELHSRIIARGAVLSEFPIGRQADRQTFAMRNRIVAGMCQVVVVVESDESGGSMITATFANDLGRTVCAIPGRADQSSSRGCHQLIREGAVLVCDVAQVIDELNYLKGMAPNPRDRNRSRQAGEGQDLFSSSEDGPVRRSAAARSTVEIPRDMPPAQVAVLRCFRGGELLSADSLVVRLGGAVAAHSAALLQLEMRGLVARRRDGWYEASVDFGTL